MSDQNYETMSTSDIENMIVIEYMTVEEVISLRGWGAMKIRGYTYKEYYNIKRRAERKLKRSE